MEVLYFAMAEPLTWIVSAQCLDERWGVAWDDARKLDDIDTLEDAAVSLHRVWIGKGWHASEHFKDEDSKGPEVGACIVSFIPNQLGRHVVWSTSKGFRRFSLLKLFGKPKIDQFDVTGSVQEKVRGCAGNRTPQQHRQRRSAPCCCQSGAGFSGLSTGHRQGTPPAATK